MKPVLIILLDAFNPEYLTKDLFLSSLYQAKLKSIIGYNCVLGSVVTGLSPAEHGRWNLFTHQPSNLGIEKLFKVYDKFPSVYKMLLKHGRQFSVKQEKPHPNKQAYKVKTIFDELRQKNKRFLYSNHPWWINNDKQLWLPTPYSDELVFKLVKNKLKSYEFVFIHLYELDRLGHEFNQKKIKSFIKVLDEKVAKLVKAWSGEVLIFSDHGMYPVKNIYDVRQWLKDELYFLESTMIRLWQPKKKTLEKLNQLEYGRFLTAKEKKYYVPSEKYGTEFWCLKQGGLICPNFWQKKPVKAMHGYVDEPPTLLLGSSKFNKKSYLMTDLHKVILKLIK
ncbi:alkaline phosphatase family protein [Patescibacteria group bacterium]